MAGVVHRLTQSAFRPYGALRPPSGALRETLAVVRADLERGGGALARYQGRWAGCLRFQVEGDAMHVRRLAVVPALQGTGVGRCLMDWAEGEAARSDCTAVRLGVRLALPGNVAFYRKLGYEVEAEHARPGFKTPTWVSMRKALATPTRWRA